MIKKPGDPRLQREKDPFDTDRHIESKGLAPIHQTSSKLIDGIFISAGLEIETRGYFPIDYIASDHRVI